MQHQDKVGTDARPVRYGGVKRIARKDELVSYLHAARNAEEHDVKQTSEFSKGGIGISLAPNSSMYIHSLVIDENFMRNPALAVAKGVTVTKGSISVKNESGGPRLSTIVNEFGDSFHPPKLHMGNAIDPDNIIKIGEEYLKYLESLVEKAQKLS